VFVVQSVLIEPVVEGGFEVDVISEVAGAWGGHKEVSLVGDGVVFVQLLARTFVVLADQTEVEAVPYLSYCILFDSQPHCLSLDITNILFIQ
jgi:hypothetical protein